MSHASCVSKENMYSFHVQSPGFVSHLAALVDGPQPVQQDGYVGCYREQMNSFGLCGTTS